MLGQMTLVWKRPYANYVQILLQRNVVFDALVTSLILLPKPSSLALTQSRFDIEVLTKRELQHEVSELKL